MTTRIPADMTVPEDWPEPTAPGRDVAVTALAEALAVPVIHGLQAFPELEEWLADYDTYAQAALEGAEVPEDNIYNEVLDDAIALNAGLMTVVDAQRNLVLVYTSQLRWARLTRLDAQHVWELANALVYLPHAVAEPALSAMGYGVATWCEPGATWLAAGKEARR